MSNQEQEKQERYNAIVDKKLEAYLPTVLPKNKETFNAVNTLEHFKNLQYVIFNEKPVIAEKSSRLLQQNLEPSLGKHLAKQVTKRVTSMMQAAKSDVLGQTI